MRTLNDVKLKELLPDSIANDGNVSASADALDPHLKFLAGKLDLPSIYMNIDNMESVGLDHLAKQYDVEPWRDSWNVALKRSVLKTAIADKRKKGTLSAVKQALASLGSAASVVEWFKKTPKGDPHTFTVYATQPDYEGVISAEMQEDLLIMVDDAKPVRSHYNFVLTEDLRAKIGVHGFSRQLAYSRVPRVETGSDDVVCSTPQHPRASNANLFGWTGTLSTLGIVGATAKITSITLYRRAGACPNGGATTYLRVLKQVGSAWVVASQSENSIVFDSFQEDGQMTFNMQEIENVSPLKSSDTVAIVCVHDPNAEAHTSVYKGFKADNTTTFIKGGLSTALSSDATKIYTVAYSPVMDIEYVPIQTRATYEMIEARKNEDYGYLQDYQNTTGVELPQELWVEYFKAVESWKKNPTEAKTSVVSDAKYIVDFAFTETAMSGTSQALSKSNVPNALFQFYPNLRKARRVFYADYKNNISLFFFPNLVEGIELFGHSTKVDVPMFFPRLENGRALLNTALGFNNIVICPSLSDGTNMCYRTKMSAENISKTLDSLPTWTDGATHTITFTRSPGIASTATVETFTVTDEDGTEYSLDYCPTFDTDDEDSTLRKAFVLAVVKKGWTVEMDAPVSLITDGRGMYANGTMTSISLSLPELTNGGDNKTNGMFYNCANLESVSLASGSLKKLKTARSMFNNCSSLKTLTGFPSEWTELVSAGGTDNYSFWGMFSNTALETTHDWTFPSLTNARAMFYCCMQLKSVGRLSFPVLTDQAFWSGGVGMFYYCRALTDISGLEGAFPKLTNWAGMFRSCSVLADISPIAAQISAQATNAFGTFFGTAIQAWSYDMPVLTNACGMFQECKKLVSISGDFSSVENSGIRNYGMFQGCLILENVNVDFPSLSNGLDMFSRCAALTLESAERVLNSLPEWTDGATHTITFTGCTTAINAGLNAENAAVVAAVARGWTVEL